MYMAERDQRRPLAVMPDPLILLHQLGTSYHLARGPQQYSPRCRLRLLDWIEGGNTVTRVSSNTVDSAVLRNTHTHHSILFLHSNAIAMASTLAAIIELVLYRWGYLSPIASIIWSIVASGAWVYSCLTWAACESGDLGCVLPLYYWDTKVTDGFRSNNHIIPGFEVPAGVPNGALEARLAFGGLLIVLHWIYLGFAAHAVKLNRRTTRDDRIASQRDMEGSNVQTTWATTKV